MALALDASTIDKHTSIIDTLARSVNTGIYLTTKLFAQLGIADEIAKKSTTSGVAAVASGNAEIALQPVSELLHAPGVDFVGTIPEEIQYVSVFAAAS